MIIMELTNSCKKCLSPLSIARSLSLFSHFLHPFVPFALPPPAPPWSTGTGSVKLMAATAMINDHSGNDNHRCCWTRIANVSGFALGLPSARSMPLSHSPVLAGRPAERLLDKVYLLLVARRPAY